MSITSLTFFALALAAVILYYLLPKRVQWCFLTLISAGFIYVSSGFDMLLVFTAEVGVAFGGALLMQRLKHPAGRRVLLIGLMLAILGTLFYFRDMAFINLIKQAYASLTGASIRLNSYSIWGPIGISYFTLSLLGYVLDVYWEKYAAERNGLRLFLFAGYFPQLTSGPIVRYDEMNEQFRTPHAFDPKGALHGGERVLWGCFMKMVVADRAALFVNATFELLDYYTGLVWLVCMLLYALQVYCDFAGCMHIVLGVSECFGIRLPENFNTPFASLNMTEFWRRWHITMGTWFKEYLMYPVLKSRPMQRFTKWSKKRFGRDFGKRLPVCLGTGLVWISIGLWHGGSARLILASGVLPGFFTVMGELLAVPFKKLNKLLHINTDCFSFRMFCRLRTLGIMCISWVFLRSASVEMALRVMHQAFTGPFNPWIFVDGTLIRTGLDIYDLILLGISVVTLITVGVLHERGIHLREALDGQNMVFRYGMLLFSIFVVLIFGIYGPEFNAANFIYQQF